MNANNKVIVVTGGGNGVGRELVLKLLRKGAYVAAVDISAEGLAETQKLSKNHDKLSIHQVNITDREAVNALAEEVVASRGRVNGLINNAGIIQPFIHVNDLEDDVMDRVMDVNFYGTLNMIKAFLPHILETGQGQIVNVSSMGGFFPVPGQSLYGASKAAVKLLSEALRQELVGSGVGVSVVIPGGINTNIKKNSNLVDTSNEDEDSSMKKILLTPGKAADLMIKSLETNKRNMYIGKDCKVMHLLYQLSPAMAHGLMNKALGSAEH